MNKRQIESFAAFRTRKVLRLAIRNAARAVIVNRVTQVRELTPNERDRLMQRRLDAEATRRESIAQVFGKKKKLPLPVFACENSEGDQVRPRIVKE